MQAIEFETDISSNVINIPSNYRNDLKNKHVKILAVYSDKEEKINKKKKLVFPKVDMKELDDFMKSGKSVLTPLKGLFKEGEMDNWKDERMEYLLEKHK